jgi:hypothetical protein
MRYSDNPCKAVDNLATRHLVTHYEGQFVCPLINMTAFLPVADDEHFKDYNSSKWFIKFSATSHLHYKDRRLMLFREIFAVYPNKNIKCHKPGNVSLT